MKLIKVRPGALVPVIKDNDNRWTIFAAEQVLIPKMSTAHIPTGIALDLKGNTGIMLEGGSKLNVRGVFPIDYLFDDENHKELVIVVANLNNMDVVVTKKLQIAKFSFVAKKVEEVWEVSSL